MGFWANVFLQHATGLLNIWGPSEVRTTRRALSLATIHAISILAVLTPLRSSQWIPSLKRAAKRLGSELDIEPINISSRPSNICGHGIRLCCVLCLELRGCGGSTRDESQSLVFEASDHLDILFKREFSVRKKIFTVHKRAFAPLTPHENSSHVSKYPFSE